MSSSDATHIFLLHMSITLIGQDFWRQNTKHTLFYMQLFIAHKTMLFA